MRGSHTWSKWKSPHRCGRMTDWRRGCMSGTGFWPNIHVQDSTRHIHSLCRIQWDCCRTRRSQNLWIWCRSWHRAITTGQQASSGPGPLLPSMFWPYAMRQWRVRCCTTLCLRVVWVIQYKCCMVDWQHVCWMCMLTVMSMVWFGLMDIYMSKYVLSNI